QVERLERLTVEWLQPRETGVDVAAILGALQFLRRRRRTTGDRVEHLRLRAEDRAAAGQAVDRHADRDLPQPAGEATRVAELRQFPDDVHEDVLRQLLGLRLIAQSTHRDREDRGPEALNQLAEGPALTRLGPLNKRGDFVPAHGNSSCPDPGGFTAALRG